MVGNVTAGWELVAEVEDLVTLRTQVCVRIWVAFCGKIIEDGRYYILEVPE